jgi:hypothetical protein
VKDARRKTRKARANDERGEEGGNIHL